MSNRKTLYLAYLLSKERCYVTWENYLSLRTNYLKTDTYKNPMHAPKHTVSVAIWPSPCQKHSTKEIAIYDGWECNDNPPLEALSKSVHQVRLLFYYTKCSCSIIPSAPILLYRVLLFYYTECSYSITPNAHIMLHRVLIFRYTECS